MALSLKLASKVCSAEEAVRLIRDGDCVTVSGTIWWQLPSKVLRALEVRFLTENAPRDLTWIDPFPTGIPGIEPLSYPGLLKRVIGGWFTPHPRLRELICANEVEAYLFPLGSLSFWCQAMAAGRDVFLTRVGLDTYMDPRNGGGKLNARTTEDLVSLTEVAGDRYILYKQLPINVAIIRASVVDEAGNASLEDEHTTMNSLYQALAAKRFGGKVIVQTQRVVPTGHIPTRLVEIPGALVDAVVVDRHQYDDESMPELPWITPSSRVTRPPSSVLASRDKEAWERWLSEGVVEEERVPGARELLPDVIIGRRAILELGRGDVVNIGQGLPAREMLPCVIEEDVEGELELSIETGHLGGVVNGLGFRANTTAILDTPAIFSLYGSGLVSAAFFSMLEFDADGSVNLLKYGDTWVGPGGSMDIAEAVDKLVFCGTLTAGGLQAIGADGKLSVIEEGAVPRAVRDVQAVCFNGTKMQAEGKHVLYITERAVFKLTAGGPELIEVARGVDLERDVLGQMCFRPRIASDLKQMDARIFTPGPMNLKASWQPTAAGQ